MKRDLQFVLVALGCVGLVGYFIHHTRHGRYGLEAQAKLEKRLELVRLKTSRLESVRTQLRRDIALLRPSPPNSDFIEELAQSRLGYAYPGDLIIVSNRGE